MSSIHNELLEAALACARQGFPVFPCLPNDKKPATTHGQDDETTDEATIRSWWALNPEYNVAMRPAAAGLAVVDIDPGGELPWEMLQFEYEPVPETYTVRTPRGGCHLYFTGDLPPSVRRLVKGEPLDTRGGGSYVLLPPSKTPDGSYVVDKDIPYVPVPTWIPGVLASHIKAVAAAVDTLDLPVNVSRASHKLESLIVNGKVSVDGAGGNATAFEVANFVMDCGLSPEKTLELMLGDWNDACSPPWDATELEQTIQNAARYRQNEIGAYGAVSGAETFGKNPAVLELLRTSDATKSAKADKFHFEDEKEQENAKEPTWLIHELLPDQSTVLFFGPTGSFKSFLALDLALAISCGTATFGVTPVETGPVFYGAHEGRSAIRGIRRRAWKLARGQTGYLDNFFVGRAPLVIDPDEVQAFGDSIRLRCNKGKMPRLIIIDTVAKSMVGLNENDARDAARFIRFCDSLVEEFGCTVLAIAHTGKDAGKGARGSSAFPAGFDSLISAEGNRRALTVEVKVIQHKDAEEREKPWRFKGRQLAQSLVFDPVTDDEYYAGLPDDPLSRANVGEALRRLGAIGPTNARSTLVLASELTPTTPTESDESLTERQKETSRLLRARGGKKLAGYCHGTSSRDYRWYLPE